MLEKDFSNEMRYSIQGALTNCHYVKIPDQIFNPRATFNPEKKYDSFVIYKGKFTAIEYKLHKNKNAFSFSNVRLIQETALREAQEAGGNAYVVIGIRYGQVRKCIFVPINHWFRLKEMADRKSIVLEYFEQFEQAKWIGKGRWEIKAELFL